jgi:hypothetical protein
MENKHLQDSKEGVNTPDKLKVFTSIVELTTVLALMCIWVMNEERRKYLECRFPDPVSTYSDLSPMVWAPTIHILSYKH